MQIAQMMLKTFKTDDEAHRWVRAYNYYHRNDKNHDLAIVVNGPGDAYSACSTKTAIELGLGYSWD